MSSPVLMVFFWLLSGLAWSQPSAAKVDKILFGTEAVATTTDLVTTYRLLIDPCRCFQEANPLAPHTGNLAVQMAFHYGLLLGMHYSAGYLGKQGHPKLARAFVIEDIAAHAAATSWNLTRSKP